MIRTEILRRDRSAHLLRRALPVIALLVGAAALPKPSEAVSFDIFLIAEHSAPSVSTGAPLSVTTQTVYQLSNLNAGFRARNVTQVSNFSFDIDTPLSFSSLDDPSSGPSAADPTGPWLTDQGETGAGTASYIDSQIATWDNSGIPGTTVDADEQIDLGRNSSVTFKPVLGGFTDLVLADLGGLDPFGLSLCDTAACSTVTQLFNGFTSGVRDVLIGTGLFALDDSGASSTQDQTWLFRFHDPVEDFLRLTEAGQRSTFRGARLQADFIGAKSTGGGNGGGPLSPVPGPASLPLLAGAIVLLGWARRRGRL